jgi:hypothetical protein
MPNIADHILRHMAVINSSFHVPYRTINKVQTNNYSHSQNRGKISCHVFFHFPAKSIQDLNYL